MARFSSRVVRSARSTCQTSDLATSVTTDAVLQGELAVRGAGEELGVLGHRAGPAALDEAHPELVEQPRDRQLVGDGVRDALALGPVAQRRVEDVEGVGEHC